MNRNQFALLCLLALAAFSCISTEQYNQTVTYFEEQQQLLEMQVDSLTKHSDSLAFVIARKEGENTALIAVQDKLQNRLDVLQENLDNLGSQATTQSQNLIQEIERKEEAIVGLEDELKAIQESLDTYQTSMDPLYEILRDSLKADLEKGQVGIKSDGFQISLSFATDLLFQGSRQNQLKDDGIEVLQRVAKVLEKHPDKFFMVIGHTDNSKPNTRYYRDNWDLSALQANAIVRLLVEEFYLSSNQVTAAAKGEFAPKASNSTDEGKKMNKRVEIFISFGSKVLIKQMEDQLKK